MRNIVIEINSLSCQAIIAPENVLTDPLSLGNLKQLSINKLNTRNFYNLLEMVKFLDLQ